MIRVAVGDKIERRVSSGAADTRAFGRRLAGRLGADATLLLYGDLGSGKTVLTQGIGDGLGLAPGTVQSPSYTLINEYEAAGRRLVHIDLYRLESADLPPLGLEELLAGPGLKVVEWAERIDFPLPAAWRLRLRRGDGEDERLLELTPPGDAGVGAKNHGGTRR